MNLDPQGNHQVLYQEILIKGIPGSYPIFQECRIKDFQDKEYKFKDFREPKYLRED